MKLDTDNGWPILDRERKHIRTPAGSFIPFFVLRRVGAIAALLIGIEATFGITNWVSIPVGLATLAWAGEITDRATSQIRANEYFRRLAAEDDPSNEPY